MALAKAVSEQSYHGCETANCVWLSTITRQNSHPIKLFGRLFITVGFGSKIHDCRTEAMDRPSVHVEKINGTISAERSQSDIHRVRKKVSPFIFDDNSGKC